jgi:hypothetical protein
LLLIKPFKEKIKIDRGDALMGGNSWDFDSCFQVVFMQIPGQNNVLYSYDWLFKARALST